MGEPGTKHEVLSLEELEAAGGMRTGRKHVLTDPRREPARAS